MEGGNRIVVFWNTSGFEHGLELSEDEWLRLFLGKRRKIWATRLDVDELFLRELLKRPGIRVPKGAMRIHVNIGEHVE